MSTDLSLAKSLYFTAIDGVASFPEVMTAIRDAIADPAATPTTVGRAVERDVAFASRLLRIVNSPAVGLIRPCASVPHAVTLVGLQRIGMHAEKVASLAALSQCAAIAPEVTERVAIEAAIARTIAAQVGISPEQAFTAALLSELGIIAIVATQPNWDTRGVSCLEEKERIGFDHAEIGADVLERWNLPSPIPDVVRHHHDLDAAKAVSSEVARYVSVLQAAAYLAPGVNCEDEPNIDEWDLIASAHPALEYLDIDAVKLAKMWPLLMAAIAEESQSALPLPERDEEERPAPVKKKPNRRSFYFAMAMAVAIPAAVGFELFFRT
jgi:HD-like signal output (HDOD) protein